MLGMSVLGWSRVALEMKSAAEERVVIAVLYYTGLFLSRLGTARLV